MIIPFTIEPDADADLKLIFWSRGTKVKYNYPHYQTIIVFNPVTKQFILEKGFCSCWAFTTGRNKSDCFCCKHQIEAMELAVKYPEELE